MAAMKVLIIKAIHPSSNVQVSIQLELFDRQLFHLPIQDWLLQCQWIPTTWFQQVLHKCNDLHGMTILHEQAYPGSKEIWKWISQHNGSIMLHITYCARGHWWVESIHVKWKMNGAVAIWIDIIQSHIQHFANAILVNMMHRISLDVVILQDLLFSIIHITQTNVYKSLCIETRFNPSKVRMVFSNTSQEAERTSMDISWLSQCWCIDVLDQKENDYQKPR